MVDGQPQAGQVQLGLVGQLADLLGLAHLHRPAEEGARLVADALERVAQQLAVVRVHPRRDVVAVTHRRDREAVVEVAVGEHHRDRRQAVLTDRLGDRLLGVLTGVDDHARLPLPGATR
ncbi:hypothetical protein GCM10029964_031990 [Kibdelosporangium lantanae]